MLRMRLFWVHPSEARADICHAQCAGVEADFFRHGNLMTNDYALPENLWVNTKRFGHEGWVF